MSSSDPLLRAVQEGDPRCPDGAAISRLGGLLREHARPPAEPDLLARVMAGCDRADEQGDAGDEDLCFDATVDALYQEAADDESDEVLAEELRRLRELIREAARPDQEVDLLPQLAGRFVDRGSTRRLAAQVDGATRWRIWTAVIAGHIAAVCALAIFHIQMSALAEPEQGLVDEGGELLASMPSEGDARASGWSGDRDGVDLLGLRRDELTMHRVRTMYCLTDSGPVVRGAVAWLVARQDPGTGLIGPASGDPTRDLAVQALACLAIGGEGRGDGGELAQTRLASLDALAAALGERVARMPAVSADTRALALWALLDAALVLQETEEGAAVHRGIAASLAAIAADRGALGLPARREAGMLLLAVTLAEQTGHDVPSGLLSALAAVTQPQDGGDPIEAPAVIARLMRGDPQVRGPAYRIAAQHPVADAAGRIDPVSWMQGTMVVRELGGQSWWDWAEALQRELLPRFRSDGAGRCWLPGATIRFGSSAGPAADVLATSAAVIALQVPYRYPTL